MSYKYLSTKLGSSQSIARGTNLSANVSFTMADYKNSSGVSYYIGDDYAGRYINCDNTILASKWGQRCATDDFKYGSTNRLPFTDPDSCPMFKCDAETSKWGDLRQEGSATIYLSYRNEANPTGPYATGIWYSTDDKTWNIKKNGYSVCFVELVGGGGGGGGCLCNCSGLGGGGGGGGGGAYVRVALDLAVTGKVTITIGKGGTEGPSNTDKAPGAAGNGGNSTLKTTSGITITCGGGVGGNTDGTGTGGSGGQVKSSLTDIFTKDASKGLLDIQPFHGKPGGHGRCHSTAVSEGTEGGAFIADDRYSSFGILATNKDVVKAGYHGYGGSIYNPYTDWETPLGGGGGGASALGGGYHSSYSGSHHGYGGGGNGAACGIKDAVAAWNDDGVMDSAGCSGGNGACIIHYAYRIV